MEGLYRKWAADRKIKISKAKIEFDPREDINITYQLGAYYFGSNIYSNANLRLGIPNLIAGELLNGFMGNEGNKYGKI